MKSTERRESIRSYFYLILIYLLAHILLNVISGQWWDDWCYWINGTQELKKAYFESGIPLQAYFIASVMWIPNWGYRIVSFFLYLLVGLLFYGIIRKIEFLSEEDAFFIAAIAMTVPVNDARSVLNCFGYTLEIALFMIGFFIATRIENAKSKKKYVFRTISLICLYLSYTMESLLVFTGIIWLYFFYTIWKNNEDKKFLSVISVFFKAYWDYALLPFLFFVLKGIFFKPYGRYAGYNSITLKSLLRGTLLSPISMLKTGAYIVRSYLLQAGMVSLGVIVMVTIIYVVIHIKTQNGEEDAENKIAVKKSLLILLLGLIIYYAGIYAYIIVRGGSSLANTGVGGRDSMLAGFGIGIMAVAFSRLLPIKRIFQNIIPIILIILGIFHFNEWYLNYQEDWYHQLEVRNAIEDNDGFLGDNTILCDFSNPSPIGGTRFYSINGMSYTVTGEKDKFYFSGINDLTYGLTEHDFTAGGYNCDNYDSSDTTIAGVLFINNASINDLDLLKMRFYEVFDKDIFEEEIKSKTDYRYVKILKETSDKIYEEYSYGELTPETLKMLCDK